MLAFEAPPLVRTGPPTDVELAAACHVLGITSDDVVDAAWTDNGPGWLTILLPSAEAVLALRPSGSPGRRTDLGVVGLVADDPGHHLEVRAFFTDDQLVLREDPVTGSLNAAAGEWLLESGRLEAPYVARQGTAMGRAGRVHVGRVGHGTVTVGGRCETVVSGTLHATP